eukprot:4052869-Amphidinium_carterae.1
MRVPQRHASATLQTLKGVALLEVHSVNLLATRLAPLFYDPGHLDVQRQLLIENGCKEGVWHNLASMLTLCDSSNDCYVRSLVFVASHQLLETGG